MASPTWSGAWPRNEDARSRGHGALPQHAPCRECGGARLKKGGPPRAGGSRNISELTQMSVDRLIRFFDTLELEARARRCSRLVRR